MFEFKESQETIQNGTKNTWNIRERSRYPLSDSILFSPSSFSEVQNNDFASLYKHMWTMYSEWQNLMNSHNKCWLINWMCHFAKIIFAYQLNFEKYEERKRESNKNLFHRTNGWKNMAFAQYDDFSVIFCVEMCFSSIYISIDIKNKL